MKVALICNEDTDCASAYEKIKGDCDVTFLLTFLKNGHHPGLLSNVSRECVGIGIPFFWAKMKTGLPEEYRQIVAELKSEYGIEGIVTDGSESLVETACGEVGVKAIRS